MKGRDKQATSTNRNLTTSPYVSALNESVPAALN